MKMLNALGKSLFASLLLVCAVIAIAADYGTRVPPGARAGDLELAPCEIYLEGDNRSYSGECGTLVVEENRKNPDSRLIALPVERISAIGSGVRLDPIFWFEGGPGSPNKNAYPSDGLLQKHDFVMVGYRGVDGEVKLVCPEAGDAFRSIEGSFLGDAALAAYAGGAAACAERIQAAGIDLDGYSMNQTIDDMEEARVSLGYDRINLFGNSYGTRLEMLYQWRYPESVHRVVMVAVNPPGHFLWDPAAIDALVGEYAALCARDAYCSARTANLVATMKAVSRDMPDHWLGIDIDPEVVRLFTFFSLMESIPPPGAVIPMNGPAAIDMWLDAAEGDAAGMALVSMVAPLIMPALLERGHLFAMGGSAADYLDPLRDYKTELTPRDVIVGAPYSLILWGTMQGWPHSSDQSEARVQDSDVETLLISGTLDFSTPMRYARDELLPHLRRGHQVILREQGHTETFWNSQPEARARLLNTFFDTGRVDDSLYQYQAPVFAVEKTLGEMAWILVLVCALAIALAFSLLFVVLRKLYNVYSLRHVAPFP